MNLKFNLCNLSVQNYFVKFRFLMLPATREPDSVTSRRKDDRGYWQCQSVSLDYGNLDPCAFWAFKPTANYY